MGTSGDTESPFDNNRTVCYLKWMRGNHGKRLAVAVSKSNVNRFLYNKVQSIVLRGKRWGVTLAVKGHIFGVYYERRMDGIDITPETELYIASRVDDGK